MATIKITVKSADDLYWRHRKGMGFNFSERIKHLYNVHIKELNTPNGECYEVHAPTQEEMTVFLLENSECIEFFKDE